MASPADARVMSFQLFFKNARHFSRSVRFEDNRSILKWSLHLLERRSDVLFVSMPPFSGWILFLLPFYKIILDVRDGWSIAIESGYGGNVPPKPLKAKIARVIERLAIRRSFITITCTTGLQDHLQRVSSREVLLIPNGILDDDLQLIKEIKKNKIVYSKSNEIIFCCAGQFSEYGETKVKKILEVIARRYSGDKVLVIRLIGCNLQKNQWVSGYFEGLTGGQGRVEILGRMSKVELFKAINSSNFGLAVIRDPDYDFGTKIYDYIAFGLPVVNYFDTPNSFTNYFDACLDKSFNVNSKIPEIRRSKLIADAFGEIKF